jgi:hypothetical protein
MATHLLIHESKFIAHGCAMNILLARGRQTFGQPFFTI